MKSLRFALLALFAPLLFHSPFSSAQTYTPKQQAVADTDHAWETVFAAKDIDKAVSFVDPDGSMFPPNSAIATGHDQIRALIGGIFSLPELKFAWHATSVDVARSGELAFTSGVYEMSFKGPDGKTVNDKGKYVTVWHTGKDGQWLAIRDIFNSDLPGA